MLQFHLPTWATTALALLAGLLQVLNTTTFGFVQPWRGAITVAVVFIAGLGIGPLAGSAFRAALHISQNLNVLINAVLAAAVVAVTTLSMGQPVRATILAVLTILAGLGFGTSPVVPPAVAK